MVGFVQNLNVTGTMEDHQVVCFFAEKDKKHLYEEQVAAVDKKQALNQSVAQ